MLQVGYNILEMARAAKRPANEPLTGLSIVFFFVFFSWPLTSRYHFLKSLLIFVITLKLIENS